MKLNKKLKSCFPIIIFLMHGEIESKQIVFHYSKKCYLKKISCGVASKEIILFKVHTLEKVFNYTSIN